MVHVSYWGTPEISESFCSLIARDDRFKIEYIVTQPDRSRSKRGQRILPSPVKKIALELGIPVFTPENLKETSMIEEFKKYPIDFHIVLAYGNLIPKNICSNPPKGAVNFHASLLPDLRGASPIEYALLRGYEKTGWTLQRISEKLDSGNILKQIQVAIHWEDWKEILIQRMQNVLLENGCNILLDFAQGRLKDTVQPEEKANYCQKIHPSMGKIYWNHQAEAIRNHCRAYTSKPGAFTLFRNKKIKLFIDFQIPKEKIEKVSNKEALPGSTFILDDVLWVVCGDHYCLPVERVQPEGKGSISGKDFLNGYARGKEVQFTELCA